MCCRRPGMSSRSDYKDAFVLRVENNFEIVQVNRASALENMLTGLRYPTGLRLSCNSFQLYTFRLLRAEVIQELALKDTKH